MSEISGKSRGFWKKIHHLEHFFERTFAMRGYACRFKEVLYGNTGRFAKIVLETSVGGTF